jgi:murein DD-endopeptidase
MARAPIKPLYAKKIQRGDMEGNNMGIKWDRVFENEKREFERMSEVERFVFFLLLQFGAPYRWGEENPEGSDCSGAVCMALYAATGLLVRTTADDLYRRVFRVVKPTGKFIRAAFFVEGATGKAVHTAGLLDEGIILNSQEGGARIRSLADVSASFWNQGVSTAIRGLDREALVKMAGEGVRYDVDEVFFRYFEQVTSNK